MEVPCYDLGEVAYPDALALQRQVRQDVLAGAAHGAVLLLTHPPTITLGRRAAQAHILGPVPDGWTVARVERGGGVTYHGPGQLVAYPILPLPAVGLGPRRYVQALGAAVVSVAASHGIEASWSSEMPGVWVGHAKLAAVGVHVLRGVTLHGLALNVSVDLAHFARIVPCGLTDRGVTSLCALLGAGAPPMTRVKQQLRIGLERALGVTLAPGGHLPPDWNIIGRHTS